MVDTANNKVPQRTCRVLIADDDAPTRMLLRVAIANWGYEIVEAKDGEQAWDILQQPNPPKILILDWLMPKLDGIALCQRIKQELTQHPFIILLTQQSGATNMVTSLEAGADEFLAKPFNMVELRGRLAIGAKIIQCQNQLAEQELKIKAYHNAMQDISGYVSTLAIKPDEKNLDDIIKKIKKSLESITN